MYKSIVINSFINNLQSVWKSDGVSFFFNLSTGVMLIVFVSQVFPSKYDRCCICSWFRLTYV